MADFLKKKSLLLLSLIMIASGAYFIEWRRSDVLAAASLLLIGTLYLGAYFFLSTSTKVYAIILATEDSLLLGLITLGFWLYHREGPFVWLLTFFWLLSMVRTLRKVSGISRGSTSIVVDGTDHRDSA